MAEPKGLKQSDFFELKRPEAPRVGWYAKWPTYEPHDGSLGGPFLCTEVTDKTFTIIRYGEPARYTIDSNAWALVWYKPKKKIFIIE